MKGKWALASVAAIAAGVGVGVYSMRHRAPAAPPVSPAVPAALAAPQQITVTGKVRAAHVVGVGAAVPGTIDAFMADVGDEVYQGQELASVGSTGLESDRTDAAAAAQQAQTRVEGAEKTVSAAQLEASRARADAVRARADLDRANKTYERQRTLFAAGATPRLTFEKAGSEYESARQAFDVVDQAARSADQRVQDTLKELDNARKILADKSQQLDAASSAVNAGMVQAPVDGLIVGRKGDVGQSAQDSGDELFQIATDLYDLEVAIEPKPEVLRRLRPGQPALVIIPDLPGTGITGQVKAIQGNQAVIGFESSLPAIRPGMVADVRLRPE